MFSDHLQKIDRISGKTLLAIAAGLVIVCQLVAMVLVSQSQVEKAQARQVSQASARAVTAWCIETSLGAALRDCDDAIPSSTAQTSGDFANPASQGMRLVTLNRQN